MECIVAPIIAALFGYLVARLQIGEKNRRIFRDFAHAILDNIKKADGSSITAVYKDSIPGLRREISRVREDVWRWKRRRFDAAWDNYCGEQKVPLNLHIDETKPGEFRAYQLDHFEEGRERLESYLSEMLNCAK